MEPHERPPSLSYSCRKLLKFSLPGQLVGNVEHYASLAPKDWTSEKINSLVNVLAQLVLDPERTQFIFNEFPLLCEDIVSKSLDQRLTPPAKCFLLGSLVSSQLSLLRNFMGHFNVDEPPWTPQGKVTAKQVKRRKMSNEVAISDLQVVECCWSFLQCDFDFFMKKWDWSQFMIKFLSHSDSQTIWVACQCIGKLLYMTEKDRIDLERIFIDEAASTRFALHYDLKRIERLRSTGDYTLSTAESKKPDQKYVNVAGVRLPVSNPDKKDETGILVTVESTLSNLRRIAIGVSTSKAVCLTGPVGCGKTALVEHLAKVTGRSINKELLKVQLGEETDSKLLLGTYKCTDLPGDFVWESGVLTKAIMGGHWLLIEDIESAPSDVAAVLSSLLEHGTVNIPGFRDNVSVAPGFQLFMTHRLLTGLHGHHKRQSSATELLGKQWLQVNIEPLKTEELVHVIQTKFPALKTIANRLVSVYMLFSMGNHDDKSDVVWQCGQRLISTRDLMKWCARAEIGFNVTSPESAFKVLQDAIDIFCSSYSEPAKKLELACKVAARLGIVTNKAEYFCTLYKPGVDLGSNLCQAGRVSLPVLADDDNLSRFANDSRFALTREACCLIEKLAICLSLNEPVLLVGETGTGKTSTVQLLSNQTGHKLIVINMNQQSDSTDLLGGYKPIDLKHIVLPLRNEFENLFRSFFNVKENQKFLENISMCVNGRMWTTLLKLMAHSQAAAMKRIAEGQKGDSDTLTRWKILGDKVNRLKRQLSQGQPSMAFQFVEGSLVQALKNGYWVLLDEINLASAETLQCLSGLLEDSSGSLTLLERGDAVEIKRHSNFRLLAAMNPSTDFGKKDLPAGIRNRFTELFVSEHSERADLALVVNSYLPDLPPVKVDAVVQFYLTIKKKAVESLTDSTGHKPVYSLRTLCRGLMVASDNKCGAWKRSLYEALCMSFLTQLDSSSHSVVRNMIAKSIMDRDEHEKSILSQPIPKPPKGSFIKFEGYWVAKGPLEPLVPEKYLLTPTVRRNLSDIARCVSLSSHPILIQGETSVGKTSLITYLGEASGNKCLRINNHQHTDLQEYIGTYIADPSTGALVFQEGILVQAMRHGYWIILDELNLAPSEVLEALNRVLDDNRELFIAETQTVVKAHANFRLFATQNPPGLYGGRKMLSRAFRNRFVELHFDELPATELENILQHRCDMPLSYCKKLVAVMSELQIRRRGSAAFAGKQGFITLRDLFRWGERYRLACSVDSGKYYDWDQHIADEGYLVLAGRVRKPEEAETIKKVIETKLKRTVNLERLFTLNSETSSVTKHILEKIVAPQVPTEFSHIVWTYSLRRLAVLVGKALEFSEPILLVGETGCGKTTICQLIAAINRQKLFSVNCHQHSESSDFLGGLRPARDKSEQKGKLFEWADGPLIEAMRQGQMFMADEISLADDSVLERMNSLLEPQRKLLISEKGAGEEIEITAREDFRFVGTMNPGGDFGKKELSPALRNRLTEIWTEGVTSDEDLIAIVEHNVKFGLSLGNQQDGSSGLGKVIVQFVRWFTTSEMGKRITVSVRDILTWIKFINLVATHDYTNVNDLDVATAYVHGACLVLLDGVGTSLTSTENVEVIRTFKKSCIAYLLEQVDVALGSAHSPALEVLVNDSIDAQVIDSNDKFGIHPFYIDKKDNVKSVNSEFLFDAPTTCINALRLIRSLQVPARAILLEGNPGVGKTSTVIALAKATGHRVTRINLSEQTDVSDLFGADLPVEGAVGGTFAWRDGPFLQALKRGDWILLDELNLASQSVVEGLNSVLDHRAEIFVPELGKTFQVDNRSTRLFGCQNPQRQGGARKGLPQSFLNRFTQVFMEPLTERDLSVILRGSAPHLPLDIIDKMVQFTIELNIRAKTGGWTGIWEWNLRDLVRWAQSTVNSDPGTFVKTLFANRLPKKNDRENVLTLYTEIFGSDYPLMQTIAPLIVLKDKLILGDVELLFKETSTVVDSQSSLIILREQLDALRSLAICVQKGWLAILVGKGHTGKSRCVQTLAQLCGKKIYTVSVSSAMDTTELLGGFEQTDYGRHLETICQNIEKYALTECRTLCRRGKIDSAARILGRVHCMKTDDALISDDDYTLAKAVERFHKRIELAMSALDILSENRVIQETRRRLKELNVLVKEQGLKAGGTFEWVDSVLIKCLEEGNWLVLDNVNLCSGAVLDRLNAMLEPGGVLTIGERGVGLNGEEITVAPHPEFRLFFTMDPTHGSISRAMRNRGVEIYIDSPTTVSPHSMDIEALLYNLGVKSYEHISAFVKLHNSVSTVFPDAENSNFHLLLKASFLALENSKRGVALRDAVEEAFIETYLKCRSINSEQSLIAYRVLSDCMDEIEGSLKQGGGTFGPYDCFSSSVKTMKTLSLQESSLLSNLKQQGALLIGILQFFEMVSSASLSQNIASYLLQDLMPECSVKISFDHSIVDCLPFAVVAFYDLSTKRDCLIRHEWLCQFIDTLQKTPYVDTISCSVVKLSKIITEIISKFAYSEDEPWDSRHLASYKNKRLTGWSRENKIHALICHRVMMSESDETLELKHSPMDLNSFSILQYSAAVQRGEITDFLSNQPIICEISSLFTTVQKVIEKLLTSNEIPLESARCVEWLYNTAWKFRLESIAKRKLFSKVKASAGGLPSVSDESVTLLTLHYKWFKKYTVPGLLQLSGHSPRLKSVVKQLVEIMDRIDKTVDISRIRIIPISRQMMRLMDAPLPRRSTLECNLVKKINKNNALIEIWKTDPANTELLINSANFMATQSGKLVRDKMISSCEMLACDTELDKALDVQNEIERILVCLKNNSYPESAFIRTWPILELICLQLNTSVRRSLFSGESCRPIDHQTRDSFSEWLKSVNSIPASFAGSVAAIFKKFNETPVCNLSQLSHLLFNQMNSSVALRNPFLLLEWGGEAGQLLESSSPWLSGGEHNSAVSLQSPLLALFLNSFISRLMESTGDSDPLALKAHKNTLEMVQFVKKILWRNLPALFSTHFDVRLNEEMCLINAHAKLHADLTKCLVLKDSNTSDLETTLNHLSSTDQTGTLQFIADCLKQLDANVTELNSPSSSGQTVDERWTLLGKCWFFLGCIHVILFSQLEPVDPVKKKALKRKYAMDEGKGLKTLISVEDLCKVILGDTSGWPFKSFHEARVQELENKSDGLGKAVAVRPYPSDYNNILKDLIYLVECLLSKDKVTEIMVKLNGELENSAEIKSWILSLKRFTHKIESQYLGMYPDVVTPALVGLSEVIHGLDMMVTSLEKTRLRNERRDAANGVDVEICLEHFIGVLDTRSALNLIELATSVGVVSLIEETQTSHENDSKLRLIKICANIIKTLHPDTAVHNSVHKTLFQVLDYVVSSWEKCLEEQKVKAVQDESIYINKMTPIQIEEEETRRSIDEMFPSTRDTDFGDLDVPTTLEEVGQPREQRNTSSSTEPFSLNLRDIQDICQIHSDIVTTCAGQHWILKTVDSILVDQDSPTTPYIFKERLDVFTKLMSGYYGACGNGLNEAVIPGLMMATGLFTATALEEKSVESNRKHYDFYRDNNVVEAKQCIALLNVISTRVSELLEEWPEHPTLKLITLIINRIMAFNITSPLSRFLTGLELLLTRLHEWEENAHAGVSLASHAATLINQIISWRRLELSAWKGALASSLRNVQKNASSWWFHLYSLTSSFVNSTSSIGEIDDEKASEDLITSLQRFMESSSLGEYSTRVTLLYTFHCHCLLLPRSSKQETLVNVFWNLYSFYKLFSTAVASKITELGAPVEKKLKEFVKIARWNDINYWSVKAAVEKTHRTVHKHIKEYEKILASPSSIAMSKMKQGGQKLNLVPTNFMNYMTQEKLPENYQVEDSDEPDKGISTNLISLLRKSRRVCKQAILSCSYHRRLEALCSLNETFVEIGQLISQCEIDPATVEEKKRAAIKGLLQRKRKAVTDLFRYLTQLGLSYRSGLFLFERKNTYFARQPPLSFKSALSRLDSRPCDKELTSNWNLTEEYYLTSVALAAQLKLSLEKPHKDLGPQTIERVKGFTAHLNKLICDLKASLVTNSKELLTIRCILAQLRGVNLEQDVIVPISSFNSSKSILLECLEELVYSLKQLRHIVEACPEQKHSTSLIDLPPICLDSHPMVNASKHDDAYNHAVNKLNELIQTAAKMFERLKSREKHRTFCLNDRLPDEPVAADVIVNLETYNVVREGYERLTEMSIELKTLNRLFCSTLDGALISNPLTVTIEKLCSKIDRIKFDVETIERTPVPQPGLTDRVAEFETLCDGIIHKSLIVMQNIFKSYAPPPESQEPAEESVDDLKIEDSHVRQKIVESLLSDLTCMRMSEIKNDLINILGQLAEQEDAATFLDCQRHLRNCFPLLDQLLCLFEYVTSQQLSSIKVLSKLQTSVVEIFVGFAKNGYNVPDDLLEQGEEGESEETKGGMGLGEGQGEKDVSDQIESLDQLEDAKRPEDYSNENDDAECKEEEKGIDMEDDFGGKLQDVEEKEGENESDNENKEEEPDKEMGQTEKGADNLDKEIWGSDDDEEEEDQDAEDLENEDGQRGSEQTKKELGAKDDSKEDEGDGDDKQGEREKKQKEINEMSEEEVDDDQVDPYHGNAPPSPEIEPLDLGEMMDSEMAGDDKEDSGSENGEEENPFDIDTMKDKQEKEGETNEEEAEAGDENDTEDKAPNEPDDSGKLEQLHDEEEPMEEDEEEQSQNPEEQPDKPDEPEIVDEPMTAEENENEPPSAQMDKPTESQQAEPSDLSEKTPVDQVSSTRDDDDKAHKMEESVTETEGREETGTGAADSESVDSGGHKGTAGKQKNAGQRLEKEEKRRKPGRTDDDRTLGDSSDKAKKRLKTVESQKQPPMAKHDDDQSDEDTEDADLYQHIKEAKESSTQIMDSATKDQAEKQNVLGEEEKSEDAKPEDIPMEVDDEIIEDVSQTDKQLEEKGDKTRNEKKQKDQKGNQRGDVLEEAGVQIEGDIVETLGATRGPDSSYHTRLDEELTVDKLPNERETLDMRLKLQQELASWIQPPATDEAVRAWDQLTSITASLARDLSEQLRLVLEPTTASGLKGDFRTGRRINMRKVIPYIASQFRKDKIWLRRSKPSKREYQIVLAVDDSSSMADNKSKELAFESLALVSRALSLLEAGDLAVLSFGETVKVLHPLGEHFSEQCGPRLLQQLSFDQKRTRVGALVDFASSLFSSSARQTDADLAQLLVIVSDGRGVMSEGEAAVVSAVRKAKLQRIFMVFVIIDNPLSKDSILDIRVPTFKQGKLLGITPYLDGFPFPFYLILRDIANLPSVLSDALRQWFELVASVR